MRLLLFLLAICAGIVWIGARAEAQNYPWCAIRQHGWLELRLHDPSAMPGYRDWYGRGFCEVNTQYQPAPGSHRSTGSRRR